MRTDETSRWIVSSLAAVGEFFGVPISTCEYWRKQGLPGEPGQWRLDEITRWRLAKLAVTSDLNTALKVQKLRLLKLDAALQRLQLGRERGELLSRDDVVRDQSESLITIREHLLSIPESLAASVPMESRAFVRSESDRIICAGLTKLAKQLTTEALQRESQTPLKPQAEKEPTP